MTEEKGQPEALIRDPENKDWHAMMSAFNLCPEGLSTPDRMRWIAQEFRRRADRAVPAARLTNDEILVLGKQKFRYGVLSNELAIDFARTIEREVLERADREIAGLRQMLDAERQRAANAVAVSNALQDKLSRAAAEVPTFDQAWSEKEKQGYRYGPEALEQVRMGWEMAQAAHCPQTPDAALLAAKQYAWDFARHVTYNTAETKAAADQSLAALTAILACTGAPSKEHNHE